MSKWVNTGDINPRSGTAFMREPEIDTRGFRAECIETVSESNVGGDEKRILIRQGDVFLSRQNFESALDTVGARLEGSEIVRPDNYGNDARFEIASEEGLRELFSAAHAYGGIEEDNLSALIQIGEDDPMDQDRRFPGDITVYPEGSSIWSIIENEASGFDYPHGKPPVSPIGTIRDADPQP